MLYPKFINNGEWQSPRCESSPEYVGELIIKTTDAKGIHREAFSKNVLWLLLSWNKPDVLLPAGNAADIRFLADVGRPLLRPHYFLHCQHVGILFKLVYEHLVGCGVVAIEIFDKLAH